MHTDEQWQRKVARETAELQRLVWPKGTPGQSAATKIYPHLTTGQTVPAQSQQATAQPAPNLAAMMYPHLRGK